MDNFIGRLAHKGNSQEIVRANSRAEAEEKRRLKLQVAEYEKILQEMRKLNDKNMELSEKFELMMGDSAGKLQVAECGKILQEIRKLNDKNMELSEKFELMIGDSAGKIQNIGEDGQKLISMLRGLAEEQAREREAELARRDEELAAREREQEPQAQQGPDIAALTGLLEDKFQHADDFVHRENVKVYRNVQAVVTDEIRRSMEKAHGDKDELASELKKELNDKADSLKKELGGRINRAAAFSAISMVASLACAACVALWTLVMLGIVK